MMNWKRVTLNALLCSLLLPMPAFAGNNQGTGLWYEVFVVWGPLAVLGILWLYLLGQHSKLRKRSFEHMDKVEELLERIAKSVAQNKK